MAWNRSTENQKSAAKPRVRAAQPAWLKGAIAGGIIVIGALLAFVFLLPSEKPQPKEKAETKSSKDVTFEAAKAQSKDPKSAQKPLELSEDEKLLVGKDTNQWIVVTDPNTGKKHISKLMRPGLKNLPPPLFAHSSLNELDAIMNEDMGDPLMTITIDEKFLQDFKDALSEKIEATESDDEERVARKKDMVETLKYLQSQMNNGVSIKDIVNDALQERRRVASFKDVMKEERSRMRSAGESEETIEEYERVCNRKLGELGARPIITKELIRQKGTERQAEGARK